MFILDTIFTSPLKGLFWIAQKVHEAAQEEMDHQAEIITTDLRELYQMLEGGKITEADFDVREKVLLDRLDEVKNGFSLEREAA